MKSSTGLSLTDERTDSSRGLMQSRKYATLDYVDDLDDNVESDVDEKNDDNSKNARNDIKENPPVQSAEKIIAASLGSIIQYEDVSSATFGITESRRRRILTQHTLRFATDNIARINVLANLLATLFFQDLVAKNLPIPPMVIAQCQIFWNWTVQFVTTENGQLKPTRPLPLKANPKPPSKHSEKGAKRAKTTTTSSLTQPDPPKKQLKTKEELDKLNRAVIEKN